jgi:hypothetical protein
MNRFVKAMNEDDSNRQPFSVDESEEDDEQQSSVSSNVSYPELDRQSDDSEKPDAGENNRMGAQDEIKLASAVENARVDRWRILVIGSILVAGAAVSCLTYLTLSAGQTNDAYDAVSLSNERISNLTPRSLLQRRNSFS